MYNNKFIYPKYSYNSSSGYCKIIAIDSCIPDEVVTNENIIDKLSFKINPLVIEKRTGVIERRVASPSLSDADLMSKASQKALSMAKLQGEDLNKIIVNKFFGDKMLPMTASFLQSKLNIKKAVHSFDIDGGLHSFFQSIDLVARMPLTACDNILISSGGICNRIVSKKDSRHAFLFGDGASAVILSRADQRHILSSYQIVNTQFSHLSKSMSFSKILTKEHFDKENQDYFYNLYSMENWTEAYDFVSESSAKAIELMLTNENIKKAEIDGIVLGCYNKDMELAVLEGLNPATKKIYSTLSHYGNTMSATLPLSIQKTFDSGEFTKGSKILFASVGEGLSIGFMIYEI